MCDTSGKPKTKPQVLADRCAEEQSHTRSSGFCEITDANQHGKVIAHFRGRSYTRGEPLIDQEGF